VDCVRILLEAKANVDASRESRGSSEFGTVDHTDETALHIAVMKNNVEMVKLLLGWRANVNRLRSMTYNEQIDPKIGMRGTGDPRGSDFISNIKNTHTKKPSLHLAIKNKSFLMIRILLLNGANPYINSTDDEPTIQTSWELCGDNEDLKKSLDLNFHPRFQTITSI